MAINPMLIPERERSIGAFTVGRLIPFRKKRQVGPFTFIDHMGPKQIKAGAYMDVDQHPHIGLCTLTYLFEGGVEHKDSTGAAQEIGPRDVGLMTAGKGVTHTERTPESLRNKSFMSHGYQIWIALPKDKEEMEPRFDYLKADEVPRWKEDGQDIRLVAGEAFGRTSPLPVHSRLFMFELSSDGGKLDTTSLFGEVGIVVLEGEVELEGEWIQKGNMIVCEQAELCNLNLSQNCRILVLGGEPFPEERYMLWNFVSSSRERLEAAKELWIKNEFPKVPGDTTYVPFP